MRARLAALARASKREFAVYRRTLAHPDTPWPAKVLLGLAVGYTLLPFDRMPNFLAIIGQLGDLVIVPDLV